MVLLSFFLGRIFCRGGGIFIATRDQIKPIGCPDLVHVSIKRVLQCGATEMYSTTRILVVALYRTAYSPHVTFIEQFEKALDSIHKECKHKSVILVRDLNIYSLSCSSDKLDLFTTLDIWIIITHFRAHQNHVPAGWPSG